MRQSITSTTSKTYKSAFDCYCRFVRLSNIQDGSSMPPISEDLLMTFATYCCQTLHLSYATIKLYICGIKFQYLVAGLPGPFDAQHSLNRLQMVLKGIKRTSMGHKISRLPITMEILNLLCINLRQGLFSPYVNLLMETVCVVAFFAFMRCAEFTCTRTFDPAANLCMGDIKFCTSHVDIRLKQSKADPFRKGIHIKLFCMRDRTCPYCLLMRYFSVRKSLFPSSSSDSTSFFVDSLGQPLTRTEFLSLLKQTLQAAGLSDTAYTGHSFRIGAATSAATANIEDHMIKTMGRWASDSYCRYIKTPISALHSAHVALFKQCASKGPGQASNSSI